MPLPAALANRSQAGALRGFHVQIQMQAFGKKSTSLRKLIIKDLNRRPHDSLFVEGAKSQSRSPGWAKIKAVGVRGALNLEWEASQRMLTARAIAKKGNLPHELLGIFVAYLVERHGKRISSLNIQLA
jgi:hypothetical protein